MRQVRGCELFQEEAVEKVMKKNLMDMQKYSVVLKDYGHYVLVVLLLILQISLLQAMGDGSHLVYWLHTGAVIVVLFILIYKIKRQTTSSHHALVQNRERGGARIEEKTRVLTEEYQKKLASYSTLFISMKQLLSASDEKTVIESFLELTVKHLPLRGVSLFQIDETCNELFLINSTDTSLSSKSIRVPMDESTLLGYAASHKMVMDETSIKQNLQISHLSMDEPFPLRLCSPVLCNEDMVGFISVSEIRGGFLSKEDQQFFTTLCMLLGMSLRNVRTLKHAQDSLASSEQLLYEKNALNERIRQLFGKFTSPSVVDSLIENQEQIALGGESKVLSAMFCDIRGFTTYCENRTPEQVVDALNEYLTRMSEVVLKYHGTLDKYIGDEIMAFWGAPLSQAHHAKLAVQASYEMLVELKKLSVAWQRDGREAFQIGVGVNTGRMIVGNIGSSMRMDYTIIGDSVNLASRVQGLTRKFQTNLLITEYTYQWVKDIVKVKKIGTLQVKGKQQPVTIYSVEWVDLKPLSNGA